MPDPTPPNGGAKPVDPKPADSKPADPKAAADASAVSKLAETIERLEERTRLATPQGATPGLDETVPGGRYIVRGRAVNAHGRELNDDGTLKYPEQQRVDAFGRLS